MKKKALIFGITGQDGSYLADFLIKKKYEVHGVIRRSSSFNTARIDHLYQDPHEKNRKLFWLSFSTFFLTALKPEKKPTASVDPLFKKHSTRFLKSIFL